MWEPTQFHEQSAIVLLDVFVALPRRQRRKIVQIISQPDQLILRYILNGPHDGTC
jgi:hypothetical protein